MKTETMEFITARIEECERNLCLQGFDRRVIEQEMYAYKRILRFESGEQKPFVRNKK